MTGIIGFYKGQFFDMGYSFAKRWATGLALTLKHLTVARNTFTLPVGSANG
jgi:hypothetical protein